MHCALTQPCPRPGFVCSPHHEGASLEGTEQTHHSEPQCNPRKSVGLQGDLNDTVKYHIKYCWTTAEPKACTCQWSTAQCHLLTLPCHVPCNPTTLLAGASPGCVLLLKLTEIQQTKPGTTFSIYNHLNYKQ